MATIQAYDRRIEAAESLAAAEQSLRSITAQELAPFVRQQEVEDAEELSRIIQDQALPSFSAFDIVTQRLSVSQRQLAESEQAVTAELQASIDAIDMAAEAQQRLEEEVRQTEVANQRFAEQLASNITSSFEDAILGARGFGGAMAGLAEDMLRLILRITVLQPLAESLLATFNRGGGGAGSGIGNFLSSVLSGLVSGSPGAPVAASGPSRTPGFQFGGAFTVPGTGGPDSQNVFFRASPGERVTVSPASAQPRITINNYAGPDTSVETQTRSGPSGEQVVEVIVRKSLDRMSRTGELGKDSGSVRRSPDLDSEVTMAIATWPTGIPQIFQPDGFRIQPRPGTIRSEPDILPIRVRRRSTILLYDVGGTILLNDSQRLVFLDWYNDQLFGGVHDFNWTHPLDQTQAAVMQFTEDPEITLIGSLQYVLTVRLQMQVA